ncbi:Nramp family divalent metal transporter [Alienimonas chondri]|uniref:Divalent metal cation transporter MntH n=1 Tax=Alienimonas chondri TaxID=2681879 RepID=A0ABX1VE45_9PLAN|nr:Nramp family divalent metal transporter [Alienimonas chondri]NNJ26352.1 Divalent metal cation transporter MntH [Alienimonas chondri]
MFPTVPLRRAGAGRGLVPAKRRLGLRGAAAVPNVRPLCARSDTLNRTPLRRPPSGRSWFGPSTLVTAALIGPGTLTTCTRAGIQHGYDLLWALGFAGLTTVVLQEMAARLGWATGAGLGEAIRREFRTRRSRTLSFGLVIAAILVGNMAYESGNLSGAVIGLELLVGPTPIGAVAVAAACGGLLWWGRYRGLERVLIGLVLLMSGCFLATAITVRPDLSALVAGFRPKAMEPEHFLTVMGLIGTTVVPYNLFLHASTISTRWGPEAPIRDVRRETVVAVLLGVLISVLIVVTSAGSRARLPNPGAIDNVSDLAVQLGPLAGRFAEVLMGIGYLAAGVSSALTAPLAAALAARGLFGWESNDRDRRFVGVWAVILLVGAAVGQSGVKLVSVILFAQVANAVILPLIGAYLLRLANSRSTMGGATNGWISNAAAAAALLVLAAISSVSLWKVLGA